MPPFSEEDTFPSWRHYTKNGFDGQLPTFFWYNSLMNETNIPGIGSAIPPQNAVSVYSQDAMDDFPVLKAFQQYIDAEQAKARKRLLSLGIFFGILTGAIIAVFVVMLLNMTTRNQELNDRLVEYAMKDRDRQSAVVVQPSQDSSALLALTAKMEELQKKLEESRIKAEKEAAVAAERARIAAAEAAKPKGPTPEELEIKRLNALLAAEREKTSEQARREKERRERELKAKEEAEEKERKRQEELEAYRRKHYPELYGLPKTLPKQHRLARPATPAARAPARVSEIDDEDLLPDDDTAINYFDDAEDAPAPAAKAKTTKAVAPKAKVVAPAATPSAQPAPEKPAEPPAKAEKPVPAEEPPYEIPVEVKGKNSSFRIPI